MSPTRLAIVSVLAVAASFATGLGSAVPAAGRRHAHAAPPAGALRPGTYVCQGAGAGMFPVVILPGSGYRAAGPAGRYAAAGQTLSFTGGSLANNVGTLEGSAGFALATIGAPQPYTHCARAPARKRR